MPKYEVNMRYTFYVTTDDINRAVNDCEFPLFHIDDDKVEFDSSSTNWEEVDA